MPHFSLTFEPTIDEAGKKLKEKIKKLGRKGAQELKRKRNKQTKEKRKEEK